LHTCCRCLVASADIAEGEVVVGVPDDAVLMADNCCIAGEAPSQGILHVHAPPPAHASPSDSNTAACVAMACDDPSNIAR
jgi:hypothetical protein